MAAHLVFRTVLLILSGNATASLLTLVRNLVIARLITVEDYGVAATFAVVMAIVEMLSTLGLQQQIIQSKSGDDPKFQASLQGFNVLRGVIAASILFVSAGAIANFLNIPEVAWAYQLMALVPLFNGLMHFDIHRLTRAMNYLPNVMTQAMPAFLALLLVYPLYLAFGDYRVMLYSIIAQFAMMMITSHIMAERRFSVGFDRSIIGGAVRFGWPLLVNNLLLFIVFNGEKMVIGRELGMASLAIFAMGFTLTLTPTLVMAKSAQNFFLPQLSAARDIPERFTLLARTTFEVALLNGSLLILAIVLIGGPFVDFVLGEKYAALVPLMVWLAILQGLRVFKAGGAVVSLSKGFTENAMVANLFRVATLPLSWWLAINGADLLLVIWVATLGEVAGVIVSIGLVRWRMAFSLRPLIRPILAVSALILCAIFFAAHPSSELLSTLPRWAFTAATVLAFGLVVLSLTATRQFIKTRHLTKFDKV